jgi:hypothetical protein
MTDRERQLESEVAWLQYGPERMELALRERNAVWNDKDKSEGTGSEDEDEDKPEEFEHVIVCGCKQCMAAHRFGEAEPDNIFSSFDDEERECIVKKCLKYHCKKARLVVIEQKKGGRSSEPCHIALVEDSDGGTWRVVYGDLLRDSRSLHEAPGFDGLVAVFKTISKHASYDLQKISWTTDEAGFFTDGSGTDYVALARRRGFMGEGSETGAEFKARRQRELSDELSRREAGEESD